MINRVASIKADYSFYFPSYDDDFHDFAFNESSIRFSLFGFLYDLLVIPGTYCTSFLAMSFLHNLYTKVIPDGGSRRKKSFVDSNDEPESPVYEELDREDGFVVYTQFTEEPSAASRVSMCVYIYAWY